MVESESGCITIDGFDIGTLGLRHLRSQMSIIPQEPFLFSGTVRSNLDPFNSYTEPDLWRAVAAVGLKEAIKALADGLDSHVVDGGNNFSQVRLCCHQALPDPVSVGSLKQNLPTVMYIVGGVGWRLALLQAPSVDWVFVVCCVAVAGPEAAVLLGSRHPAQQQGADAG
jgi:hypothetical protein